MTSQAEAIETNMEYVDIPGTGLRVSRVAIGTWAIGGWMWGGTDEAGIHRNDPSCDRSWHNRCRHGSSLRIRPV